MTAMMKAAQQNYIGPVVTAHDFLVVDVKREPRGDE